MNQTHTHTQHTQPLYKKASYPVYSFVADMVQYMNTYKYIDSYRQDTMIFYAA